MEFDSRFRSSFVRTNLSIGISRFPAGNGFRRRNATIMRQTMIASNTTTETTMPTIGPVFVDDELDATTIVVSSSLFEVV